MSDLRPVGVKTNLRGQEVEFLFSIYVIEEIQEKCNMPLMDAIRQVAMVADNEMTREAVDVTCEVIAALIRGGERDGITGKEVGRLLGPENYRRIAWDVLRSYGLGNPDPDEDNEEEDNEVPNLGAGQ